MTLVHSNAAFDYNWEFFDVEKKTKKTPPEVSFPAW